MKVPNGIHDWPDTISLSPPETCTRLCNSVVECLLYIARQAAEMSAVCRGFDPHRSQEFRWFSGAPPLRLLARLWAAPSQDKSGHNLACGSWSVKRSTDNMVRASACGCFRELPTSRQIIRDKNSPQD
ncbi:hypothetical protein O181_011790 [Austropuccinia psidii MF-1]|uniref:Uncharacterized protein n=1 Tax=Austropuccinia psidii MF-1 TaxID=1389203 RepID=A0A9Q3GM92_9BASI|nr:hypothetical protein [Austropuccinia psidii MF-1]